MVFFIIFGFAVIGVVFLAILAFSFLPSATMDRILKRSSADKSNQNGD